MTDFNMHNILKSFDAVEKKILSESKLAECPPDMGMDMPQAAPGINISLSDPGDMAKLLMALQAIQGGNAVPAAVNAPNEEMASMEDIFSMGDDMHAPKHPADIRAKDASAYEGYDNEPDEEVMDLDMDQMSGGINKKKSMYKAAQRGDNAMAVESIKNRLWAALSEKKAKPDFLDMDKDGNKKEPMKKAIADKKKGSVKESFANLPREDVKKAYQIYAKYMKQGSLGAEAEDIVAHFATTKLGYSPEDADKLAQRAAIMHIDAVGEAQVDEISSDLAKRYTKAAKMDRDFNDDDIKRLSKSGQSTQDMHRRNAKRTKGINRAAKRIEK